MQLCFSLVTFLLTAIQLYSILKHVNTLYLSEAKPGANPRRIGDRLVGVVR
jgi:hypothetical protein